MKAACPPPHVVKTSTAPLPQPARPAPARRKEMRGPRRTSACERPGARGSPTASCGLSPPGEAETTIRRTSLPRRPPLGSSTSCVRKGSSERHGTPEDRYRDLYRLRSLRLRLPVRGAGDGRGRRRRGRALHRVQRLPGGLPRRGALPARGAIRPRRRRPGRLSRRLGVGGAVRGPRLRHLLGDDGPGTPPGRHARRAPHRVRPGAPDGGRRRGGRRLRGGSGLSRRPPDARHLPHRALFPHPGGPGA